MLYDTAAPYALLVAPARLSNPTWITGRIDRTNLAISENRVRCSRCFAVLGFPTLEGKLRMYCTPFHEAPTTLPTFPEKPPRIPFLIVPILLICLVESAPINLFIEKYPTHNTL